MVRNGAPGGPRTDGPGQSGVVRAGRAVLRVGPAGPRRRWQPDSGHGIRRPQRCGRGLGFVRRRPPPGRARDARPDGPSAQMGADRAGMVGRLGSDCGEERTAGPSLPRP
ncbi:unnamed protein product [Linum tenue]|uniref:Uncharacterized protein n=1 Tax=Linum tenue TaxID=586396 RepID=A0AAV0ICY5_9ROSI|nr:unnamed protein product [Linum tenue]